MKSIWKSIEKYDAAPPHKTIELLNKKKGLLDEVLHGLSPSYIQKNKKQTKFHISHLTNKSSNNTTKTWPPLIFVLDNSIDIDVKGWTDGLANITSRNDHASTQRSFIGKVEVKFVEILFDFVLDKLL